MKLMLYETNIYEKGIINFIFNYNSVMICEGVE